MTWILHQLQRTSSGFLLHNQNPIFLRLILEFKPKMSTDYGENDKSNHWSDLGTQFQVIEDQGLIRFRGILITIQLWLQKEKNKHRSSSNHFLTIPWISIISIVHFLWNSKQIDEHTISNPTKKFINKNLKWKKKKRKKEKKKQLKLPKWWNKQSMQWTQIEDMEV